MLSQKKKWTLLSEFSKSSNKLIKTTVMYLWCGQLNWNKQENYFITMSVTRTWTSVMERKKLVRNKERLEFETRTSNVWVMSWDLKQNVLAEKGKGTSKQSYDMCGCVIDIDENEENILGMKRFCGTT